MAKKKTSTIIRKLQPTNYARMKSREFIMQVIGGEDGLDRVVYKVFTQALKGSYKHQELLMNYLLGKPVERLQLEQYIDRAGPTYSPPVIKIVADHMRLEKLYKDVGAAEGVIDESRIQEMESVLNKHLSTPLDPEAND